MNVATPKPGQVETAAPFSTVHESPPTYAGQPARLLDRVRWHLRVKRYSIRTEQAYLD